MRKKIELEGIIPAAVLPQTPDWRIDEVSLRRYINWLTDKGIGGVAVNVDTGEGSHLSREERKQVLQIWVEEVNGRIPIIAGVTANYTDEAIEEAKSAEAIGADALLIFPISAFSGEMLPVDIPYNYHKAISDEVNVPIILFQLQSALGGVEYSAEALRKLVEIENVVAIKEASFDVKKFVETRKTIQSAVKKITLLTGNDNFIYESFILGADGALIGFGTIATELQIEMFNAVQKKDYREAEMKAEKIEPLAEVIFAPPVGNYRARLKEGLVMLGILNHATVRPPLIPITEKERTKIRKILKQVGLL